MPITDPPDRFATAPISQLIGFDVQPGEPGHAVVHLAIDD